MDFLGGGSEMKFLIKPIKNLFNKSNQNFCGCFMESRCNSKSTNQRENSKRIKDKVINKKY